MGIEAILDYRVNIEGEQGVTAGFHRVAASMDDTDRAARKSGDGMTVLSQRLARAQSDAKALREEFAETGDIGILKEINKADRDVKRFSGWIKNLGDDSDHTSSKLSLFARVTASAGEGVAALGTKLVSGTGIMNPYVLALGGGIAASTLFAAAAAAGGLTIAGFGLAAIAAGAKVRSSSAAMESSLSSFGKTASDTLFGASAIVEREFIPALSKLQSKIAGIGPHLGDIFIGPASAIGPLERGIEGLIDHALPGLEDAANASSSVLRAVASELPNLGDTIGGFFNDVSSGSEGGTNALLLFIRSVEISITTLGKMVEAGEKVWTWLEKLPASPLGVFEGLVAKMSDVNTQNEKVTVSGHAAARAIEDEGAVAAIAKTATRSLSEALGLLNFDSVNAAQAQIQSTQATNHFAEALHGSKNALNGNSTAALANRAAALSALEGYGRTADSVGKLTGNTAKATASFYANVEALRQTVPAGSTARAQLDALIATFVANRRAATSNAGSIAAINTQIALLHDKQVTAKARGEGAEVARLQRQIDSLHGKVVYLTTIQKFGGTAYGSADAAERAGSGRAAGGEVAKGRAYQVGEVGREWFVPSENGSIVTERQMAAAAGGGGGGNTYVTNYITTGADPDDVVRAIQKYGRRNNGVAIPGGVRTA